MSFKPIGSHIGLLEKIEKIKESGVIDSLPDSHEDDPCSTCSGWSYINTPNGSVPCPACVTQYVLNEVERNLNGEFEEFGITFKDILNYPNYTLTPALMACQDMFNDIVKQEAPRAIILAGNYGRGKTSSSIALMKELALKQVWSYGFKLSTLVYHAKRGVEGNKWIENCFKKFKCSTLIFLDEIGKETTTGNQNIIQEMFSKVVYECYPKKSLILSTNLTKKDLGNFIPGDCRDRLKLNGKYCSLIEDFDQDSLRG